MGHREAQTSSSEAWRYYDTYNNNKYNIGHMVCQ